MEVAYHSFRRLQMLTIDIGDGLQPILIVVVFCKLTRKSSRPERWDWLSINSARQAGVRLPVLEDGRTHVEMS